MTTLATAPSGPYASAPARPPSRWGRRSGRATSTLTRSSGIGLGIAMIWFSLLVLIPLGALIVTATAGGRTFRFRDVGADVARVQPDGSVVLLISGQVPFFFAGALKIDPETEEVLLEPKDRSEAQVAKACRALAG